MNQQQNALTVSIRVPFGSLSQEKTTTVEESKREAYLAAIRREVSSAAGIAGDTPVTQVNFIGGSSANMTLKTWCYIMDDLAASFQGVRDARLLLEVTPELVNFKCAQYALRYHSCISMELHDLASLNVSAWPSCAEKAAIDEALQNLAHHRIPNWGFSVPDPADGKLSSSTLGRLLAYKPGFIRLGAIGAKQIGMMLVNMGYQNLGEGLFAVKKVYRSWFPLSEESRVEFGLGGSSKLPNGAFLTTEDLDLYIAQAGLSSEIYQPASV